MNIKDSYIHNGTAVLKDIKVESSVLKKILAGKDANDAYLDWETVCDLTGIKPTAAGTADKVGHKLTFSGGVTGDWDGSAAKTVAIPQKSSWNYDDVYLKLIGGDLTGKLTISSDIFGNQFVLNRGNDGGSWGPSIIFKNGGNFGASLGCDTSGVVYIGDNGSHKYKVYHENNLTIKTLMGTSAIGDSDEPVYWSGNAFVKAGAYPTKSSWNYDDVYLKDVLLDTGNSTDKDKTVSLTNTNVYLKLFKTVNGAETEDSKIKIYGATNVSVTTDASGDIKITGVDSVTNAATLTIANIYSESEISTSGVNAYKGDGGGWTGELTSMAYAAILAFGSPNRGFQLWATRGANDLHWRNGTDDSRGWLDEKIIIDSNNYTSYTVTKTGSGASGTWGINISGTANTATNLASTPSIQAGTNNSEKVTITAGNQTSSEYTIPYASKTSLIKNASEDITANEAGWHILATYTGENWRYHFKLIFENTGGNYACFFSEVDWFGEWGNGKPNNFEFKNLYTKLIDGFGLNVSGNNRQILIHFKEKPKQATKMIVINKSILGVTSEPTFLFNTLALFNGIPTYTWMADSAYTYHIWPGIYSPSFKGALIGNADTATSSGSATYASNVGAAGTAGTNYVTAANVISMYSWYNTITATDAASNTAIDKWNEIVSFLAGITDTSTLSGILAGYSATDHKHAASDITSGTLGVARGGTGLGTIGIYSILYASAADTLSALAPNTTSTKKFLRMTGNGSAGAAPAWDTVTKSDVGLGSVENTALSTWAGTANITTVGTIGTGKWQGTAVGVAYGGTGKTSWTKNGLVYASDTTTLAQIGVPSGASTTYWLKAVTNASGVPTYSFSTIGKSDVGLGNVDNTADANKSVNYATSAGSAGSATNATNLSRTNTSLNSSAAGWYKLAKIKTTDARGCVRLGLVTTGGSYVPYYAELMVENGWGIITFNLFGRFDYITQFRYTTDDTYSYIEGYFYNALTVRLYKLDGVGYVNDVTTGWELYSGTAVAGSGTVTGSECAQLTSNGIYTSNFMCSAGFKRVNSDDTYVLLGGGNHKALSQFVLNSSQHEAGVVSQDATTYSLSNATWTDTINLPTDVGSYILYLRTGNSTLTGIFSVGTSDNAKDEISLHLHGNGTRLYARTNNTKLQLSSNYVPTNSNPTQNTSVVIKYKRII